MAAVVAIVRTEVAVPPAVKVTGLMLNEVVSPVTGVAVDPVSVTLPAKPFWLVSVMVDVAEPPATKLAGVAAPALIPKFGCSTITVVVAV